MSAPVPETSPSVLHSLRHKLFDGRARMKVAWVAALILVVLAQRTPSGMGLAIIFAGAALRFWASGFIEKNHILCVGGPYRFVRNPLYVGTAVMALGAAFSVGAWIYGVLLFFFFAFLYDYVARYEEEDLEKIFGEPYRAYCAAVGRFFPKLPFPSRARLLSLAGPSARTRFSWTLGWKANRGHEAFSTALALSAALWVLVRVKSAFGL